MNKIDTARKLLIDYQTKEMTPLNVVADKLGCSPLDISQFMNNEFKGENKELANTIISQRDKLEKKDNPSTIPIDKQTPSKKKENEQKQIIKKDTVNKPVDEEKTLKNEDIARDRLISYQTKTHVSLNIFAKDLGRSASALSQFINSKYQGDNEDLAKLIINYLDKLKKRNGILKIPVIETKPFRDIMNTLLMTETEGEICLIVGDNGAGKTIALKEYAASYGSIVIESDPGDSPRSLLRQICRALKLDDTVTIDRMRDLIIEKAPARLLIIDEAENLPLKSLNFVRRIFDKSRFSLALFGGPDIRAMLATMKRDHRYIWRRIPFHIYLGGITDRDVSSIISASGLSIPSVLKEDISNLCYINGIKNVDLLVRILKACYRLTKTKDFKVDSQTIKHVKTLLLL